jgi:hypothetical protein
VPPVSHETAVHGVDPEASVAENAPLIIAARVQDFVQWEPFLSDPSRVAELHQMRIAAKRLRYTLEIFAPVIGGVIPMAIERMKVLQDLLGDIHDLDVAAPLLMDAARKAMKIGKKAETWQEADLLSIVGLCGLCRRKQVLRRTLHTRLRSEWRRFRKEKLIEALCSGPDAPDTKGDGNAVVS